ncbi:GTP-binding protein [Tulasnella sp. JGI-2019a]|nr:GTP-binding protein [Tulasnella sp. JGI-2019a]
MLVRSSRAVTAHVKGPEQQLSRACLESRSAQNSSMKERCELQPSRELCGLSHHTCQSHLNGTLQTMFAFNSTSKVSANKATLSSTATELLNFTGNETEDVTVFLRDVKRIAHAQGRQDDDKWLIDYVELCLAGSALRWFSELNDDVTGSWKSLRRAFLQRFEPPTAPDPAAATPPSSRPKSAVVPFPANVNDLVPQTPSQSPPLLKLLLIGDSAAGKSALLARYCNDDWDPSITATIGVDFKTKVVQVDGKPIKLQIWDTAGPERFRAITTAYFRGAAGIMLLYDVTARRSFDNINIWKAEIDRHASADAVRVLVGNKCDSSERRAITREEGVQQAQKLGMHFVETSAKTNEGVEDVFLFLAKTIVSKGSG